MYTFDGSKEFVWDSGRASRSYLHYLYEKKNVFNSRTYTCGGSEEEFVWCSKVCVWCSKVRAFYKLFCIGFVLYFFQV